MPGFDRTGPMGQGPRTGGGFGYCGSGAGAISSGGFRCIGGFGRGRCNWRAYGGGIGYGRRPRFRSPSYYPGVYSPLSRKEERDALMAHIADLKSEIAAMENQLAALDADKEGKADA
jgi:hypothetical protein